MGEIATGPETIIATLQTEERHAGWTFGWIKVFKVFALKPREGPGPWKKLRNIFSSISKIKTCNLSGRFCLFLEIPSFSLLWLARLLYRTLADSLNVGAGLLANDKGGTGCWKQCGEQVLERLRIRFGWDFGNFENFHLAFLVFGLLFRINVTTGLWHQLGPMPTM